MASIFLPTGCLYIIHSLQEAGFAVYLVGGAVRDQLAKSIGLLANGQMEIRPDYDFATNATPEEIMKVFPDSFCENEYGTVSLPCQKIAAKLGQNCGDGVSEANSSPSPIKLERATKVHESLSLPSAAITHPVENYYEITTYRVGEKYERDCRHPSCLHWGQKLTDDLSRRDFTINALALSINSQYLKNFFAQKNLPTQAQLTERQWELVDNYHGIADLQANLIRCIGESNQRFREDGLRLMRAVRLSVQLNFAIEEQTYLAIKDNASLLQHISFERIRDELMKILSSNYPKEGIMLLHETGLLLYIIPELLATINVAQSGHHLTDVWIHSLSALEACPSSDPLVRLATLLHDIGKPATQKMINGKYTFYNHEVVGASLVYRIAQRLRFSREQTRRLVTLVRHHMFSYNPEYSDAAIRRFMRKVGLENLNDILALREGDRLGSNAAKTSWRLEEMKQRMIAQLHQPLQVRDLAINGHDLMTYFNLSPGPILGKILQQLMELVLEDSSLNTKEILLQKAKYLVQQEI